LNDKEHEEGAIVYVSEGTYKFIYKKNQGAEQNHIMMSIKICNVSTLGQLDQVWGAPFVPVDSLTRAK
jgi:hypothetical protein